MTGPRTAALVLAGLLAAAPSMLRAETLEELFHLGNTAYEQGRYDEASRAYRSLLRYRVVSPVLEYNLANSEFKQNRLGPAILHYQRALRLDPSDEDTRGNLAYAKSFCKDRVEDPEQIALARWLRARQLRLGSQRQAWAALSLIWAAAALLAWRLSRPGGWRGRYGWMLAGLLIVATLCALSGYDTWKNFEGRRLAVVQTATVDVLAGPSPNNPTLFSVHEGLTLEVRVQRERWWQVSLPNGLNGWIESKALSLVATD